MICKKVFYYPVNKPQGYLFRCCHSLFVNDSELLTVWYNIYQSFLEKLLQICLFNICFRFNPETVGSL
jgi:hypothetical protein